MGVLESLSNIEAINRRFADTGNDTPQCDTSGTIIGLRQEFAMACANLVQEMINDPAIFSDSELFDEVQDALDQLRRHAWLHQMHWQAAEINADKQAYFRASQTLNAEVHEFVVNVRKRLVVHA